MRKILALLLFCSSLHAQGTSYDFCSSAGLTAGTQVDPQSAGTFTIQGDTVLSIATSHGSTALDMWTSNKNAPRIWWSVADADFTVTVKMQTDVTSGDDYDLQGLFIRLDDDNNFVRFDTYYQSGQNVFQALIEGGSSSQTNNTAWAQTEPLYLRVTYNATAETFAGEYSPNGSSWNSIGTAISTTRNPTGVGLHCGDASSTGGIAHTALFDFISFSSDPVDGDESQCETAEPTAGTRGKQTSRWWR